MPLDTIGECAFRLFTEAYAKAWAPKPRLPLKPIDPAETPLSAEDEILIADIIAKSKAWGENPF